MIPVGVVSESFIPKQPFLYRVEPLLGGSQAIPSRKRHGKTTACPARTRDENLLFRRPSLHVHLWQQVRSERAHPPD